MNNTRTQNPSTPKSSTRKPSTPKASTRKPGNTLVIVESPNKVASIGKYLGEGHTVASTKGHFADIPERKGSVDVNNGFAMDYRVTEKGAAVVEELRRLLAGADELVIATDADREGEMIAHLLVEFLVPRVPVSRARFNAITADAIREAMENRGVIDEKLVEAARARRALDFLVGFHVSPALWNTVRPFLSAGRVQSPALHMIVQREMERRAFVSVDHHGITMHLAVEPNVSAVLRSVDGRDVAVSSHFAADGSVKKGVLVLGADEASALAARLEGRPVRVEAVDPKAHRRRAPFPYITTSVLQDSMNRLGLGAKATNAALQVLFEKGLITYPRTDSPHMAPHAIVAARNAAVSMFGPDSVPAKARPIRSKVRNAQEAHEAIRPVDFSRRTAKGLGTNAERLYDLVWRRTVASQMVDATGTTTTVTFEVLTQGNAETCRFTASGTAIEVPGFRLVLPAGGNDEPPMPAFAEGHRVEATGFEVTAHRTTPPARFNEGSLIAALEKEGIGRPSTYQGVIATLRDRYVWSRRGDRALIPTVTGVAVDQVMAACFAPLLDYGFTARVEEQLENILDGSLTFGSLLQRFYADGEGEFPALRRMVEESPGHFDPRVTPVMSFGVHPDLGEPVTLHAGRPPKKGTRRANRGNPYLRCGTLTVPMSDETEIDQLTSEAAFALVSLDRSPRVLGTHEGHEVHLLTGRHGPYLRWDTVTASVPKKLDPAGLDLAAAVELIEKRRNRP